MRWKPARVRNATVAVVLGAMLIGTVLLSGCQFLLAPVTYKLTVNVVGQGTVTRSPNQTSYQSGQAVTLEAEPADGWAFSQWSGDASGTNPTTTVTLNSSAIITATFVEDAGLELEIFIDGNGSVAKDPDQDGYEEGDEVELTADPDNGWVFSGWSGDASGTSLTTTITIDDDPSVTATFVEESSVTYHELNVNIVGQGTVSKSPLLAHYAEGAQVDLTANPATGWSFSGWGGDASGTSTSTTITIDSNPSVTATFVEDSVDPILELSGAYTGTSDSYYGTFELDYSFTNEGNTTITISSASYWILGSAGGVIAVTETKDTFFFATLAPGEAVYAELDGYSDFIPYSFEFEISYGDTYGNSRTQTFFGNFTVN